MKGSLYEQEGLWQRLWAVDMNRWPILCLLSKWPQSQGKPAQATYYVLDIWYLSNGWLRTRWASRGLRRLPKPAKLFYIACGRHQNPLCLPNTSTSRCWPRNTVNFWSRSTMQPSTIVTGWVTPFSEATFSLVDPFSSWKRCYGTSTAICSNCGTTVHLHHSISFHPIHNNVMLQLWMRKILTTTLNFGKRGTPHQ